MIKEQKTVLLVEDDENIMSLNRRGLARVGYNILEAENLTKARIQLDRQIPDVIVLDILLPDGNGLDFLSEIRAVTTVPVILLTARNKKDERIEGLRAGGDDYITKPYDMDELRERVAAAIRRGGMTPETLTRGPLVLKLTAQRAFLSDDDMMLTPKEFSILLVFVTNMGKMLTKDFIYEKAWGQEIVCDNGALYAQIKRLKRKLEHPKLRNN
jgi:DNA-binding response OmpR family regulator